MMSGIFPSIFYYHYLVIKTQSSIEFQNPILYHLPFQKLIFHGTEVSVETSDWQFLATIEPQLT